MTSVFSNRKVGFGVRSLAVAALTLMANVPAHAGLTLTAAGVADNFVLTNYARDAAGIASSRYSYLAAAKLPDGSLVTLDYGSGLHKYADVDGQTPATSLAFNAFNGVNLANVGNTAYMSVLNGGLYVVDPTTLASTQVSVPNFVFGFGLAANPVTGHLLAASNSSDIFEIDPITGTHTAINTGRGFDGVSVSPDGTTVYGASGGSVFGYNIASHAQVFSRALSGSPDGTGVIAGGQFNGYVIANNNDGTVTLIDPTGTTATIIASGGTRGDFTSPDLNNGTLLLSEYGESWRLRAPGGVFGPPASAAPEPATITLCSIMAACMATYAVSRRKLRGQRAHH